MVRILAFMGASGADGPGSPDQRPRLGLRASDAERDEVAARLRDEYVAGRLSHDTFVHRINAVLQARQRADLSPLVADLPPRPGTDRSPLTRRIRDALARLTGYAGAAGPERPVAAPDQGVGARADAGPGVASGAGSGPGSAFAAPRGSRPFPAAAGGPGGVVRPTAGLRVAGDPPLPVPLRFPRVAAGEFSIGRDANCDLAIADMTVSRRHATLERTPDGWLISDLASTNGTRVNGWRVRGKVAVRPGDLIAFGNLEAVFARDDHEDRDDWAYREDREDRKEREHREDGKNREDGGRAEGGGADRGDRDEPVPPALPRAVPPAGDSTPRP
jgi:hypothetical protein